MSNRGTIRYGRAETAYSVQGFAAGQRKNRAHAGAPRAAPKPKHRFRFLSDPMYRNYGLVGIIVAVTFYLLFSDPKPVGNMKEIKTKPAQEDMSAEALVNRYLQDADARHTMATKSSELENRVSARPLGADAAVIPENDRQLGVSLGTRKFGRKGLQ